MVTENPKQKEMSGTVTQWLKPRQPLALWWQRNYPGLREESGKLAARVLAAATLNHTGDATERFRIPVDTEGLRYYEYGLVGGAIDYRLRMEFTQQWGGNPNRSAFTRAWSGRRGSIGHAAAGLLADCAPALSISRSYAGAANLGDSLPALDRLVENQAGRLDRLAPWDWAGPYASSGSEEPWVQNYCILLADLDNFYRSWGTTIDFTPLLSPSGYRSAMYASGQIVHPDMSWRRSTLASETQRREAAERIVDELARSWPLFTYLMSTPEPALEDLAISACGGGRAKGDARLRLIRQDLAAQMELWRSNPARRDRRPPKVITANPTFSGSTRLPGDGDLILRSKDGTGYLLDFKSPKRIEAAGMLAMLRQVLTYALMDERDEYEIRRVGFYFSRYGVWAHWELQELLDASAAPGHTKSLDSHQQGLRKLLLDLQQPQALDVAIPHRRSGQRGS